jgi:hypothetical protein
VELPDETNSGVPSNVGPLLFSLLPALDEQYRSFSEFCAAIVPLGNWSLTDPFEHLIVWGAKDVLTAAAGFGSAWQSMKISTRFVDAPVNHTGSTRHRIQCR